ncbi:MAG TPA: sigma-70 family RNA polymerase sigma factor [Spirochaetota bacterium]|nr:sigma-70 family RNA polymerase sigma factor [Spirochaetota bacterium]HOD13599.1 sigma-70 family RNA polymerase sigma factor [Spirochaetota bacterium]HPG52145.1 sigma-70 family RNA polymerase sigma factor [Spirochaetota bacterium]HPN10413.1 sigma-70 family RNA polymerase sigma factor [Spirochaetota bacterium]
MLPREKISSIYKSYSGEIFRYLIKLSGDRDSAEDLLQEVFEKFIVYTSEKEIQENKYRPFLYTTAHNLCVNHLIKQNRTHPANFDEMEDSLKTDDTYHELMVADELNKKIYSLMETMDAESRSIFIMHKEGGLNYDEIAENLSLSSRTVRRRIKNIMVRLYDGLKNEGFIS